MRIMQCWDDGDDARWQALDSMIGRLANDPATEWIDVKDLFV